MNRRYLAYGSAIAALLAVNLLHRGLSTSDGSGRQASQGKAFEPRDFQLRVNLPTAAEPRRNLFAAQTAGVRADPAARTAQPLRAKPKPLAAAPVPAPAPAPADTQAAAAANLGRLRLLGVVFRGGQGQAYLALDKDSVIAHSGDTVFGQFTVDTVAVDAVELRDLKTNTARKIPVSGR